MDKALILEEVKLFKGIPAKDTTQDKLIELAINESVDRVLAKLNEFSEGELTEVPNRLTFIIRDVAIKRYNRLNSEGANADSEEGRSFNWDKYLDEYENTLRSAAIGRNYQARGITRFI